MVIIIADHGLHMGPYAVSPPGKVENVMPANFVVLPSSVSIKQPEIKKNLFANQQKLTTHYDMHKTLLHLLSYPKIEHGIEWEKYNFTYLSSAKSMLEPVPSDRTCETAAVPTKYCRCFNRI